MRFERFLAVLSVTVYLWFTDFDFFETRGFGYDHIYYKGLLESSNLNSFLIKYISEGATEPLSAIFLYSFSLLPLGLEVKFFLVRLIIFLIFILGCRSSNRLFFFGIFLYLTPLMQTLFQSNLRQGLSISVMVLLLPWWSSLLPYFIGTLAHFGTSIILAFRILSNRYYLLIAPLTIVAIFIGLLPYLPADFINTLSLKLEARIKIVKIGSVGYLFHLIIILSIYLISRSRSFMRLDKKSFLLSISIFTLFFFLLPLNNVPQRLIPFVWFLPIHNLYQDSNTRNVRIIFIILLIYTFLMWVKTI